MADTPHKVENITLSDGTELEISLLPLKYYAELLKGVTGSIKQISQEWDGVSNDEILEQLPDFIANHLDEAALIVSVATRGIISKNDVLNKYGLADTIEILTAALAVNDIEGIGKSIKKAIAVFRKPQTSKHAN